MKMQSKPRYFSGFLRSLIRIEFLFRCLYYLLHPRSFPLFYVRTSKNGILRSLHLEKELALTKIIYFNKSFFTTTSLPHYPSKAFDHAVAHGALNLKAAGTPIKRYVDTVILGISRRCIYSCKHCYERYNLAEQETIPIKLWMEVVRKLQNICIGTIILSGGEPMMRYDDVLYLLHTADKDRSDFHLHTSGYGITKIRAQELRKAGLTAAAIGFEDFDRTRYVKLRGNSDAFDHAVQATSILIHAGILVYLNLGLTKELVRSGDLWHYFDFAKELGVGFIQLLEPRPCGGYTGLPMEDLFTSDDQATVREFVQRGNTERCFKNHPLLFYVADIEHPQHMGCGMGGNTHFTIDSAGHVKPCVFVPVSFGNIMEEDVETIFARMRQAIPKPLYTICPSILLTEKLGKSRPSALENIDRYEHIQKQWNEAF